MRIEANDVGLIIDAEVICQIESNKRYKHNLVRIHNLPALLTLTFLKFETKTILII